MSRRTRFPRSVARLALGACLIVPCVTPVSRAGPDTRPASPTSDEAERRAAREAVDRAQMADELLGDRPAGGGGPSVDHVRSLMDDAARRLAERQDAGHGTQYVQEQIVAGLDELIRREENRCRPVKVSKLPEPQTRPTRPPVPEPGDPLPKLPKAGAGVKPKGARSGGFPAATPGGGDAPPASGVADDFRETAESWGKVSPRLVGPMIEGRSERVSEKYRGLVDDYYRAVATKATE